MKKKTTYIWMGTIVVFSVALFAIIYFFHLQDDAIKVADNVKPGGPPTLSYYIQGDINDPLEKPMDVTKVGQYVYVTDTSHKQVQAFDTSGTPIFKFGKEGTDKGQFEFPYGITGDKAGNIYVADLYNAKISIFTSKGKFIKYFEVANKVDELKGPGGLRIYNNTLYVTDIPKNKVMVFDLTGKKLLEINNATGKGDLLNSPNAITIDNDKNIYVSDTGNQRLVVYDKNGKYKRTINGSTDGKGNSKFVNPRGIGVEENGTLLLVDNMTHYVYGFDKNGKQVFQYGGLGSDKDQFYLPNGLFVDDKGEVFITDTVNARVGLYY
ncbi:6-bladed beta-propeller [Neobacillus drentensis]|uniref:6-bladed beta-propeller n=1 Tax=Neobacillus drentensis TaxID=220684 RepID=UPI002FFFDC1B